MSYNAINKSCWNWNWNCCSDDDVVSFYSLSFSVLIRAFCCDDDDDLKLLMVLMIWSRESFDESSLVCFCFFWIFHQNQQKLTTKRRMVKESLKSVNDERLLRIFLSQNRFFSLQTVKKCMKKRPHRHTQKRDQQQTFFPNTTKTTQHQSSCSLLLLTRFDHHHRSSRRMSPPNLLDLRTDHRRWKSARWGWKKVRYCFRFRRLAS